MANLRPTINIPTGYESAQRSAEARRRIAQSLLEQGLGPSGPMQSWAQVLGKLGQTFAGSRLEGQADKMDTATDSKIYKDYADTQSQFNVDAQTLSPDAMVQKYHGSKWISNEDLQPYRETMTAGMKEKYKPPSPNDSVVVQHRPGLPDLWLPNAAKYTYGMRAQGYDMGQPNVGFTDPTYVPPPTVNPAIAAGVPPTAAPMNVGIPPAPPPIDPNRISLIESMNRNRTPGGAPLTSPSGAMFGMQVLPSTANHPGYGVKPAASQTAEEYNRVGRDYASALAKHFGNVDQGVAAYNAGPGRIARAITAGGPDWLSHTPPATQNYVQKYHNTNAPPPDGMTTDGRPYWMVNGQPYDNPDGR